MKAFSAAIAAFMIAAVIGLGSIGTYIYYGKPAAPDQPLEARLNAPLSEQTPDIQIANMERRLRRIQRIPPAGRPWRPYISGTVFSIKRRKPIRGRFTLAARTKTSFWGWWNLSRSQMTALFPMQGAQALRAALKRNPYSLRGRFWSGLLAEQEGKRADAEKIYRDMLAAPEIHPTLRNVVTARLRALTAVAAGDGSEPKAEASGDGLDADKSKMIRGMVDRLAARLAENKADLQGWLMLIRSYAVLKETGKAEAAIATAREQFASDAGALAQVDGLMKELKASSDDAGAAVSSGERGRTAEPSA